MSISHLFKQYQGIEHDLGIETSHSDKYDEGVVSYPQVLAAVIIRDGMQELAAAVRLYMIEQKAAQAPKPARDYTLNLIEAISTLSEHMDALSSTLEQHQETLEEYVNAKNHE